MDLEGDTIQLIMGRFLNHTYKEATSLHKLSSRSLRPWG